jgi:7-carboxy-7-deazaguanine synthase
MAQKEDGEQKIPVIEIFGPTFQGEGNLAGHQTYFVRFGGCDYRCTKCDSMHAVDGDEIKRLATYMTQSQIFESLANFRTMHNPGVRLWTFSGGNPALWELGDVVNYLHQDMTAVAIETQGTYYKPWIQRCDFVTISPKGPGMGEKFLLEPYLEYLENLLDHPGLCIKIVVFSAQDIEFAVEVREITEEFAVKQNRRNPPFFLSLGNPNPPGSDLTGGDRNLLRTRLLNEMEVLCEEILGDPRCARFIFLPQVHVLIWGNKQGV